jgi:hypothetical protein
MATRRVLKLALAFLALVPGGMAIGSFLARHAMVDPTAAAEAMPADSLSGAGLVGALAWDAGAQFFGVILGGLVGAFVFGAFSLWFVWRGARGSRLVTP